MKKNSIITKSIGFSLILFLALSCQKSQDAPLQTIPGTGSTISLKTIVDTIQVVDSLWLQETHSYGTAGSTWQVGGAYYSNLTPFVGHKQILGVLVNTDGAFETVSGDYTLSYRDGLFKWSGSTLYFSGPYGQLSFRSVQVEIITKD